MPHPAFSWRTPAEAFRLHAWSATQLEAARQAFGCLCEGWTADWALNPGAACIGSVPVDVPPSGWIESSDADGVARIWTSQWAADRCAHERLAFGAVATPVTDKLVQWCRSDFESLIASAFGVTGARVACEFLPSFLVSRWSGALQFSLGDIHVVASPQATRRLLEMQRGMRGAAAVSGTLCTIDEALSETVVDLDLELDGCEVEASTLLNLEPGDVVCLAHRLEDPVHVRDIEGHGRLHGELCCKGGKRAVQLSRGAPDGEQGGPGNVRRS